MMLNALHSKLELEECEALAKIRRKYAMRFLTQFRNMLLRFNLSRHNVTISSGMGSACLCINGKVWPHDGRLDHRLDPVICELRVINSNLSAEWADYINDESLTHWR